MIIQSIATKLSPPPNTAAAAAAAAASGACVQVYSGGDECMLGGGRRVVRRTEVRIACSPDRRLRLLIREPDFCHYVYVLYSPALCLLDEFKPKPLQGPSS